MQNIPYFMGPGEWFLVVMALALIAYMRFSAVSYKKRQENFLAKTLALSEAQFSKSEKISNDTKQIEEQMLGELREIRKLLEGRKS